MALRREVYERVLHAISLMRRDGLSLMVAAQEAGVKPETVIRFGGDALVRVGDVHFVRDTDTLERRVRFYDDKGRIWVTIKSSTVATEISAYHDAMKRVLRTGDRSVLIPFEGRFVVDVHGRRHPYITDPDVIRRLARTGQFRFDSIY